MEFVLSPPIPLHGASQKIPFSTLQEGFAPPSYDLTNGGKLSSTLILALGSGTFEFLELSLKARRMAQRPVSLRLCEPLHSKRPTFSWIGQQRAFAQGSAPQEPRKKSRYWKDIRNQRAILTSLEPQLGIKEVRSG